MKTDKPKIMVLGSAGMAGHMIYDYFKDKGDHEVVGVARRPGHSTTEVLDLSRTDLLGGHLKSFMPNYVINCAGKLVEQSSADFDSALFINGYFPHYLEMKGVELGYKLVHISTDCVFSGARGDYLESDPRDGDTPYALTKATGEVINSKDLTIRTSIIGPELDGGTKGLLAWFLSQDSSVNGYAKAMWTGVTTLELAKFIDKSIRHELAGLYHLCPSSKISKYELLNLIATVWEKNISIERDSAMQIDKSLRCSRTDLDYCSPEYKVMLEELFAWISMKSNPQN